MSENEEKEADALQALVETTARQLGEHFDSVIIITTQPFSGGEECVRFKACTGNNYANFGAVCSYIECYKEKDRIQTRDAYGE